MTTLSLRKRFAAPLAAPLVPLAHAAARRRRLIGVLNLHSVPARYETNLERLLDRLEQTFVIGDPFELEAACAVAPPRPILFLTFDDGLANHAEVVAPVLERRGLRATFCLPVGFLEADDQLAWFREHVYPEPTELHADSDVRALNWDQARGLVARGHRLCSHGWAHVQLGDALPGDVVQREVVESRRTLEERLGASVDGFCWPIRADSAPRIDAVVRQTYAYALVGSTRALHPPHDVHGISRTNVEVSWPGSAVELQLARMALRP